MSEQNILHIRQAITEARAEEANTHALQNYIESQLPQMHRVINLPEDKAGATMIDFVTRYIEHVPDFVEALTELTKTSGIHSCAEGLLTIAQTYFAKPPELVNDHKGLHALIDEAYLAHRLMEEVNDRIMMKYGIPLVPMDMTVSNLIVHNLLGDDFANELDTAVHYSIEGLFKTDKFIDQPQFNNYVENHKRDGWDSDLKRWPCLAGDSSITLNLDMNVPDGDLH
ncbi:MAG: hypothetical protein COA42_04425 [Alteromonadaceae bacterium]|nr:MAG: hypothetical protein COA42_04425 [Alteromonadaceae bacterium]